ncbi:putative amidase-like protein [Anaerobacterium chartisolvens]|uniref:Putative amidase-like protein n=1 Tax=Anaerobacterium chartisolvens TaxID=1297424 RepID=A0A369BAB5_9FIRM|nr:amidase domain-containing protein [Anaerobacterium chartisolvens]RCX17538.1 putative amidase-like protein [Anaerobacterium chartisolvens]
MENRFGEARTLEYNRQRAVEYAHYWAYKRNMAYLDFESLGGDCTNFASQVIYAGSGIMNYRPIHGWYYINSYNRTASWTGVNYLHDFIVGNLEEGPFAEQTGVRDIKLGDIVQLSFNGDGVFNHSPVVVAAGTPASVSNILVAAHSDDQDNYKLTEYEWSDIRFIHIKGVRAYL